jgi:Na+/proline symporter
MIPSKTIPIAMMTAVLLTVGVVGFVAIVRARRSDAESFFRGAPSVRWLFIAASLYAGVFWASWIAMIGLGVDGASGTWISGGVGIALGLLATTRVTGSTAHESDALTPAGTLAAGTCSATGILVAAILLAATLFLWIPLTLMIGSRILSAATGWDLMTCGLMIIVVPGLLTVAGGQVAVASMQLVAAAVTLAGLLSVALAGGAVDTRIVDLQAGLGQVHWLVLLFGAGVNTFWFTRGDHAMFQQIRGAAGTAALQKAGLAAAVLVLVSAASILAGNDLRLISGDEGLRLRNGIVGAAVLTLAMASLAGSVMSASTLICVDFTRLLRRQSRPQAQVLSGRLVASATLIAAILAMSFVSLMNASGLIMMMRLLVAILVPLGAASGFAMIIDRGRGARLAAAILAGVAVSSVLLWAVSLGGSEQERIILASISALVTVLGVMMVPVRSEQAATAEPHDAGELAGVRK